MEPHSTVYAEIYWMDGTITTTIPHWEENGNLTVYIQRTGVIKNIKYIINYDWFQPVWTGISISTVLNQ